MPPFQIESWSKSLINNEFDLHEYELVGGTHLHMNGFARRLALS